MAKYPKFHGITLAGNAVIENMHFERLDADPVPVSAGRIWYNLTEKAVKFSTLDAGGAVIVRTIATGGDAEALAGRVTALETLTSTINGAYINKDGSVAFTGDINAGLNRVTHVAAPTEDTDAANKKFVLDSIAVLGNAFEYVGTVEGGAQATPFDLATLSKKEAGDYYKVAVAGYFKLGASTFLANVGDGLIFNTSGEVDKIDNTDSTVEGTAAFITVTGSTDTGFVVDIAPEFKARMAAAEAAIAAEVSRAQAAEAALDGRLTTAETSIATQGGQIAQLGTDLTAEVTRAQNSEAALAGQVAAEKTRAEAAEADLQGQITALGTSSGTIAADLAAEVNRAVAAEQAIDAKVTAEVNRATAAEGALDTKIADEKTRAEAAEAAIDGKVTAEVARATAAEAALDTKITDEVARAQAAEKVLQNQHEELEQLTNEFVVAVNGQRKKYVSPAAALTHTFAHNLGTDELLVSVMVKGDDGVFRNDIVAYEETDGNTITIFLTEARIVKVMVQSLRTIHFIPN